MTAGEAARIGTSTTRRVSDRAADAKRGTWVYFSRLRFLTSCIFGIGQVKETGVWSGDLVLYVADGSVHQPTSGSEHAVAVTHQNLVGILRTAEDALPGLIHADPRVRRGALEALADLPVGGHEVGHPRARTISGA